MAKSGKKKGGKPVSVERRSVARNRKARHDYLILDELECGISLVGTEVKSLRAGQCTLQEAFVKIQDGEMFLMRMHIPEYKYGNSQNHDTKRTRKLLAHRTEIRKWEKQAVEKGTTLIPLEVYFQGSHVKVLVGLAKGKKQYDKRADLKDKQDKRAIDRAFARKDR